MTSSIPETQVQDKGNYDFFVVGIGASAGGLRALEEFFANMPADSGAAYVVIQHLSPDFKSLMKELLGRTTRMEIFRVEDGMEIKPNRVYLIPPGQNLEVRNRRLQLQRQDRERPGPNFPIDIFLQSLGEDAGDRAIA
ncbi:MAG: chemotaxis protein CheB, partial [Rivularia sp. (in: cyanobacteria)]